MRFRKFDIPNSHPWKFPTRYPYIILEGPGRTLSKDEERQIKAIRENWRPSEIAKSLSELLQSNVGKTVMLQVQNPENYYDSDEDLPKPFIADLTDVVLERVLDFDLEFDQLFILLSNPRHMNGDSVFNEYDYDYQTLLKLQNTKDYKLNFATVIKLSIEKPPIWRRFFRINLSKRI